MTTTIDAVTKVLKDRTRSAHDRRMAIQELVDRWLDAETISKLALAKNWKAFDEAQQKDFVLQFRRHLVLTYYRNVDRYSFDRIEVYDARDEKAKQGDWTVRTKVIAPAQDDVLIDVRVRPTADGSDWKVIDLFIEGVSLVTNFRSQFQEVLSNGKPEQLLQSLREKNEATEQKYVEAEGKEDSGGGG
ncbi:MAG TPA: ABC transporter substrate-binding protein [Planctomycetota bacterium]|nr:ABC transporter substrate-binding protein [Planctomycetota bacterium]